MSHRFVGTCAFVALFAGGLFSSGAFGALASPMTGIYANVKIPDNDQQAEKILAELQGNPYLTGVLLAVPWKEVESAQGQYDFSRVDQAISVIHKADKKFKFKIMAGVQCPDWIYDAGVERFQGAVPNPNRSTFGQLMTIPVPWDPVYQGFFSAMIKTFGERYAADPACVAVTLTCANFMSAEMHLPRLPEDMPNWEKAGLTTDKLLGVYKKYLDEWTAAFPRQLVCLHMSKTTNLDVSQNEFVDLIVAHAMEHCPTQFALQNNGLNGRKEEYQDETHPLVKYRNQLINGMQNLDSFQGNPERQGTMEMSILNFIRMDAEYWELWTNDGMNADLCKKLTDELAEARAMGYEAYKQKLIDSGQYRKAEDDTWPQKENEMRQQRAAK